VPAVRRGDRPATRAVVDPDVATPLSRDDGADHGGRPRPAERSRSVPLCP
jgi:hypothetical protein